MGTEATYHLSWDTPEPDQQTILKLIAPAYFGYENPTEADIEELREVIEGNEPCKWYDIGYDLAGISRRFPETVFTLDCQQEWESPYVIFIHQGKCLVKNYTPPTCSPEEFAEKSFEPKSLYRIFDSIATGQEKTMDCQPPG